MTLTVRPAWIRWRCHKVAQWIRTIRDRLVATRPDLRLTLTAWQETLYRWLLGEPSPALQVGARPSLCRILLEGGIDLTLLAEEPGIELDLQMGDARDRTQKSKLGPEEPLENACEYRDANDLDQETLDATHRKSLSGDGKEDSADRTGARIRVGSGQVGMPLWPGAGAGPGPQGATGCNGGMGKSRIPESGQRPAPELSGH